MSSAPPRNLPAAHASAAEDGWWRRLLATLPMRTSLFAVGVVWLLGCVWSFQEQTAFAGSKGFTFPHLLPLVIDGFAVSMAGVSWAASLDARPALPARLATLVAVGASSASNGAWAYLRTRHDLVSVALGMAVPIAANLAFEVLLAELRRQVQRRRGLPAPVAIPYPRLIRFALAPWSTFRVWRLMVLELTALADTTPSRSPSSVSWAAQEDPRPTGVATASHQPLVDQAAPPTPISALTRSSTSSFDPRAVALAQQLATMDEADNVTGSRVGPLLGLDIAPRTGRRLLGQARQLLNEYEPTGKEPATQPRLTAHR